MKLFSYEVKKLFGIKQALIFTALLLALNCILCIWTIRSEDAALDEMGGYMNTTDSRRGLIEADLAYRASEEEVLSYYTSLQTIWEDYWAICDRLPESSWPAEPEFAHTYSERYDDWQILHDYFDELSEIEAYPTKIQALIAASERTAEDYLDFGGSEEDYLYRYQQQCIERYSKFTDKQLQKGYVYGWDRLFDYTAGDWMLFLSAIYLGAILFTRERSDGMQLMLRATPNGRSKLALAKIAATFPISGLSALLFTLTSFATVGILCGYSAPFAELQLIEDFLYSPYSMNMAGYLVCLFLFRWLAAEVLLLIVCFCSVWWKRLIPAVAAGLLLCGASLYLAEHTDANLIYSLNLFSLARGADCYRRFYAIPIGNLSIPLLAPALGIAAILLVIMTLFAVWCHSVQSSIVRSPKVFAALNAFFASRLEKVRASKKHSARESRSKSHSSKLFPYEAHKLLSPVLFIALALLIGIRIYGNLSAYPEQLSYYEASKEAYCQRWGGVMTEEKLAEAEALYAEFTELVNDKDRSKEMLERFSRKEIPYEEYCAYVQSYQEAEAQLVPLESVLEQMRYLTEQSKAQGVETVLFYEMDFRIFLDRSLDLPLYCVLLLLLANSFSVENTMTPILRTTRYGRQKLWMQKMIFALVSSFGLTVGLGISDILIWLQMGRGSQSLLSATLVSCRLYEDLHSDLTVGQYLLVMLVLQAAGFMILSGLVAGFSGMIGNAGATLLAVPLLTLTPYLLSMLGNQWLARLDFTALLSGDRLFRMSIDSGGMLYAGGFISLTLAISLIPILISRKKMCS